MFGAILSCTDTVAVLALLKEVGAPKKFNSLIEGESLLNDGACMVLFYIASLLVKGISMSPTEMVKLFISLTVGGVVLGIIFGMIASQVLKMITNDPILTVNTTLISCYLIYFVAENIDLGIHVSGIMALVSMALYMSIFGKTRISTEDIHFVEVFWKFIVYAAESTIFLLAGLIVSIRVFNDPNSFIQNSDYGKLFLLYICMIFSRFLSIACFMNWLKNWGN